jgi:soluble lytic murein transglycosylase-like protein
MRTIWLRSVAVTAVAGVTSLAGLAVSAVPAAAAPHTVTVKYTVRAGDSFSAIAGRFAISAGKLAGANGLRLSSMLQPGRVLSVPGVVLPANLPRNLPAKLWASPDRLFLYPAFAAAAQEAGIPADLLMATAYMESGWQTAVVSPTGAIGVGQLLPGTAGWLARGIMNEPGLNPYNGRDNIRMSARFLRMLLDATNGDVVAALERYYQGPGSVTANGPSPAAVNYATVVIKSRRYFR